MCTEVDEDGFRSCFCEGVWLCVGGGGNGREGYVEFQEVEAAVP